MQIKAGVVDESVPLSTVLQKVIVLGGEAGSEKMREWARHELNGYTDVDILPDYRRIRSSLNLHITNRAGRNAIIQRVTPSELPASLTQKVDVEEALLGMGVGELEALADESDKSGEPHRVSPSWADQLAEYLNEHAIRDRMSVLDGVYWLVPNTAIKGLLVRVRTALAELVAELATLIPGEQDVPDKFTADRAIQFVITGERTAINVTNQRTDSGSNVSVAGSESTVLATGNGTAIGSQTASGHNSTVVGAQIADGDHATIIGRDSALPPSPTGQKRDGWWQRLRKSAVIVALIAVTAGITAVLTWLDWTPW